MRLPRVRFTVRSLVFAVAGVALILAVAEQLQRRRESFQQQAEVYRRKTSDAYMAAQVTRSGNLFVWDPRTSPAYQELGDHYDSLRAKHEQAAARPWHLVTPDLPEPSWPKGVPKGVRGR
jgi:hypothetical protein